MLSLVIVVSTFIATPEKPIVQRTAELQATAWKANRGHLGCGIVSLTLITSRGTVTVESGLDPYHVFGSSIKTADLIALLQSRADSNRTGKAGPMSGEVSDLCYVCMDTLSKSKDPQAVPVLVELLQDDNDIVRIWATTALLRLHDADEGLQRYVEKVRFPKRAVDDLRRHGKDSPTWLQIDRARTQTEPLKNRHRSKNGAY